MITPFRPLLANNRIHYLHPIQLNKNHLFRLNFTIICFDFENLLYKRFDDGYTNKTWFANNQLYSDIIQNR